MKNLSKKLSIIIVLCLCFLACEEQEEINDSLISLDGEDITIENGMFVFSNDSVFNATLLKVNNLSNEEYLGFLRSYGIDTYRSIFEEVIKEEWAISDYYENQAGLGKEVPEEQVHSITYNNALKNGIIRLVEEGNKGSYFDYNIFEVSYASLINTDALVKVGKKIYQFGLDNKKIIEDGDYNSIKSLKDIKYSDLSKNISVVHYRSDHNNGRVYGQHNWIYSGTNMNINNGWENSGNKRRFKAYIQGSSYVDNTFEQRLYVTNVLRIEGQKKNFWGTWGYRETYNASANVSWGYVFGYDGSQILPSSHSQSPFTFSSSYVNNAFLNLAPHTTGYYIFPPVYDCGGDQGIPGLCGELTDGVTLTLVNGSVNIYDKSFNISRYRYLN